MMSSQTTTIFIFVYGLAFLLLLAKMIVELIKGKGFKRVMRELMSPLGMIVGSLLLWYVYIEVSGELRLRF